MVEEQVGKVRLVEEGGQEAAHAGHVGVVVCMRVRQGAMQQQQMSGSATRCVTRQRMVVMVMVIVNVVMIIIKNY